VQNSGFVHKQKSCPDLPPGSRVTSALVYAQCKSMILFSLTGLSTESGIPYLLLSMLYTVIGCKPEMPVSKKKFLPWQIATTRSLQAGFQVCGEPNAYPQDGMCKNPIFSAVAKSVHLPCTVSIRVLQPVSNRISC